MGPSDLGLAVEPAARGGTTTRRGQVLGIVALTALLALVAVLWIRFRPGHAAIGSLAVLPFENGTRDPDSEYLSDGITESLIDQMSRVQALRVMARATVFRFKGSTGPAGSGAKAGRRRRPHREDLPTGRPPLDFSGADGRRVGRAPLGRDVRQAIHGPAPRAERDRVGHLRWTSTAANGAGEARPQPARHREPRGLRALPEGSVRRKHGHRGGIPSGAAALSPGGHERPELRAGATGRVGHIWLADHGRLHTTH